MKFLKFAVAAVFALGATSAYAFHSGGVAECGGCHSMHSAVSTDRNLLIAVDQSSTCLSCHLHVGDTAPNGYHIASAYTDMNTSGLSLPLQRTPGGDFSWLLITRTTTVRGTVTPWPGSSHGHNIVAAGPGFTADPTNATAPGGSFISTQLACTSCHDQHGQARRLTGDVIQTPTGGIGGSSAGLPIANSGSYGNSADPTSTYAVGIYRLLRATGGAGFPGAPVAVVPSTYNVNENGTTGQVRVAYGTGAIGTGNVSWGAWCGTCHTEMNSNVGSSTGHKHPVDFDLGAMATNYNTYIKSGWVGGGQTSAFTSLVPYAIKTGITKYSDLKAYAAQPGSTNRMGPDTGDQVTCLTCHRAHASAFDEMLRFNLEGEFVTDATGAYKAVMGYTVAEMPMAYNGRDNQNILVGNTAGAVIAQRALCNKCHVKD